MNHSEPESSALKTSSAANSNEAAGDEPAPLLHQQSVVSRIRNYFLTGLILVGPLYITISLTWWFINWVDDIVRPIVPVAYRPETYLPFQLPGLGLIVVFATLTLLGFLTANLVGRKLVEFGERILNWTPIVRPIYRSLKQIFETLFSKSGSGFRRVGLVGFPPPACGRWCSCHSRPATKWQADCRTPSTSRYSCRARPIRPRVSSFTCRAAR
jgi:hypothetical protein